VCVCVCVVVCLSVRVRARMFSSHAFLAKRRKHTKASASLFLSLNCSLLTHTHTPSHRERERERERERQTNKQTSSAHALHHGHLLSARSSFASSSENRRDRTNQRYSFSYHDLVSEKAFAQQRVHRTAVCMDPRDAASKAFVPLIEASHGFSESRQIHVRTGLYPESNSFLHRLFWGTHDWYGFEIHLSIVSFRVLRGKGKMGGSLRIICDQSGEVAFVSGCLIVACDPGNFGHTQLPSFTALWWSLPIGEE
jgi:hypothetical protein